MVRTLGLALLLTATSAMAIDLRPLWDFSKPAVSEERFRAALATAQGDDALILKTQIARTYAHRVEIVHQCTRLTNRHQRCRLQHYGELLAISCAAALLICSCALTFRNSDA